MTRPLAGLVAVALGFAPQDAAAPLALVPPPFVVERAHSAASFVVSFQLGEEGPSRLEIALADPSAPEEPGRAHSLSLDFDPFDGARFRWSDGAESARLTQSSEPRGLRYELRFRFPAGRGVEVTLGDGTPLLVATTPRAATLRVSFTTSGSVLGLSATPVERAGGPLAEALAKLPPSKDDAPAPAPARDESWSLVTLTPAKEPPAAVELHALDVREAPEGAVARIVLEPAEAVQLPAVVVTAPGAAGAKRRGVLLVAGGARGKNDASVLARVASDAKGGAVVAAVDLLGCGERRQFQPHDSLATYELRLVGRSAGEFAVAEIRQLLAWFAQRDDVDPAQVELWADATTLAVLEGAGAIAGKTIGTGTIRPAAASPELADAARFTEDEVRIRYDSWLLADLFGMRDEVATPDRARPLAERVPSRSGPISMSGRILLWNAKTGIASSFDAIPPEGALTVCASDLGPKAALEFATAAFAASGTAENAGDRTWIALDDGPATEGDLLDPDRLLGARVANVASNLSTLLEDSKAPRKLRLFGEGSCGVVMLLAATQRPDLVESVTALHALPSFELLLYRPVEASRAAPSLGVLTQGMPAELFVQDALARFELEECVLELRKAGVAVDWREPVDALRRPLSRHDRLAMWPRVRRLDRTR